MNEETYLKERLTWSIEFVSLGDDATEDQVQEAFRTLDERTSLHVAHNPHLKLVAVQIDQSTVDMQVQMVGHETYEEYQRRCILREKLKKELTERDRRSWERQKRRFRKARE